MKRAKRIGLWTAITCGFLAGVMSTEPLELKAAAQGAYLSDVIVITDKDIEKAKTDGYTVMDMPIGEQSFRQEKTGSVFTKTYIGYKTTNTASDAIRDMKFMNMNGGYDFAKYDEYLESVKVETSRHIASFFTAIEGYRKFYKLGTKQGNFAHEALNIFRYNENEGLNSDVVGDLSKNEGINMKLGDLLLDENLVKDSNSKVLIDIFMEGNSIAKDTIYSMLNIANTKDENGRNILEVLEEIKNVYYMFADRTDLNEAIADFENDFERIRDEVNWYNNESIMKYEDFDNTYDALTYSFKLAAEDVDNHTNYADVWNNASKEIPFLSNIKYKGLSGSYENLLDLIMDEEADRSEYYPLFACMTEGVKATAFLGIVETLTNTLLNEDQYLDRITALKNTDAYTNDILGNEGISVFHGVDRALYQKGYVAMTTSAEEGAARGDEEWKTMSDLRYKKDDLVTDILKYLTIGAGGVVGVNGLGWIVCRGLYGAATQTFIENNTAIIKATQTALGPYKAVEFGSDITYVRVLSEAGEKLARPIPVPTDEVEGTFFMTVNKNASAAASRAEAGASRIMYAGLKSIFSIGVMIAFIAFVVTLVLFIINLSKEKKEIYNKYTEIPGILCHRQPVYEISSGGTRLKNENNGYVYYYGATNPYTVVTKARFGNDDDGTLELGENKRNVQDIFNWELGPGKSREWVCLYYTKDVRANYPITTSSLKLLGEVGETVTGATYFNNSNIEYNINTILVSNYYDDKNINSDKSSIAGTTKKYLRYSLNQRVREDTSKLASVISNPTTWGLVIVGLALGLGGGILTFFLIDKKRKKSTLKA